MSTLRIGRYSLCMALLAGFYLSSLGAAGAAEPELLFEDDFSLLDSSFNSSENAKFSVENRNLLLDVSTGYWTRPLYQSAVFENADVSVQVKLQDPNGEKGAYVGLIFWAQDYTQYSFLAISDSGTVAVGATSGQRTLYPLPWRQSDALKTGADEWNLLRVVTMGDRAAAFLNGKKLGVFKGKPPKNGSLIGFVFSPGNERAVARVQQLRVVAPSGDDAVFPPSNADPDLILADDFSVLDPGWGTESGSLSVKNQSLTMKPKPGYIQGNLFQAGAATEIDATVKVSVSDNDPMSDCAAGLIFWSSAPDDYFIFKISDQGEMAVSRFLKTRWLYPLSLKPIPAEARFKPDATNELRVITSGNRATVWVNGVSVGVITGVPMKGDWQFGLYAESGKSQAVAQFSSLRVRRPKDSGK